MQNARFDFSSVLASRLLALSYVRTRTGALHYIVHSTVYDEWYTARSCT